MFGNNEAHKHLIESNGTPAMDAIFGFWFVCRHTVSTPSTLGTHTSGVQ